MEEQTTMQVNKSDLIWLKKIRDRLQLKGCNAALSKIKQTFKNLKLEGEL